MNVSTLFTYKSFFLKDLLSCQDLVVQFRLGNRQLLGYFSTPKNITSLFNFIFKTFPKLKTDEKKNVFPLKREKTGNVKKFRSRILRNKIRNDNSQYLNSVSLLLDTIRHGKEYESPLLNQLKCPYLTEMLSSIDVENEGCLSDQLKIILRIVSTINEKETHLYQGLLSEKMILIWIHFLKPKERTEIRIAGGRTNQMGFNRLYICEILSIIIKNGNKKMLELINENEIPSMLIKLFQEFPENSRYQIIFYGIFEYGFRKENQEIINLWKKTEILEIVTQIIKSNVKNKLLLQGNLHHAAKIIMILNDKDGYCKNLSDFSLI
ncbi:hypothetical protein M0813_23314 [Anaeramoeba flamelloides]|uniref:Sit4 -associating protein-related n=1 Tax=Anaeramoeba flamelloides TaxID=1746091 RepID=A0AAV8AIX1_9EUKA|nr:sit4 -associating protein-related [Anaeramoeba flamelloides]KAJ6241125.1 hypothetical protein M0813_23314 [Anaeramoeba flamelloides]